MQIQVNGQPHQTEARFLAELLAELAIPTTGIAVAINESVVRRANHATRELQIGDKIEIIRAVQGG